MAVAPDLAQLEAEVTGSVVNAIKHAKEYASPILATPYGAQIVEAIKTAGQLAITFKQLLLGIYSFLFIFFLSGPSWANSQARCGFPLFGSPLRPPGGPR